jgi:dienelactone hydrolase
MPEAITRRGLAAAALLAGAGLAGGRAARADSDDAAIAANPILARIAKRDPATARKLVDDIQARLQQPGARGLAPIDGDDRALLEENPLLGKLYIHDASAALLLLKRVKEAAGGGK